MSTDSAALSRLIEQVEAGLDVLVTGAAAETRQLLGQAAAELRPSCRVVEVAADAAGLSLSSLMAQLSGRSDLDAHDDAVLELGFRRLAVPEAPGQRTVLLLNASRGVQRSALRFLQHVGRGAPGLTMVLAAGPELEPLLDEPTFAALRARLTAAPAVTCDLRGARPAVPAAPVQRPEPVPPAAPRPPPALHLPEPGRPQPQQAWRGRSRVWAVSGAGMAASLALGAWIGHASAPRVTLLAAGAAGSGPGPAAPVVAAPAQRTPIAPLQQAEAAALARAVAAAGARVPVAHAGAPPAAARDAPPDTVPAGPIQLAVAPAPVMRPHRAPAAPAEPAPAPALVPASPAEPASSPMPSPLLAAVPRLAQAAPADRAVAAAPVQQGGGAAAAPLPTAREQAGRAPAEDAGRAAGLLSRRAKLAFAHLNPPVPSPPVPNPPLPDTPVPPVPPKADGPGSPRGAHWHRVEPRFRDGPARLAERQAYPPHMAFREPMAAGYGWQERSPSPGYGGAPGWGARSAPPAEPPYLGTYAAGPYGMRVFRYER